MDQSDVLLRFREVSLTLGRIEPSQSDAILRLGQVIANASSRLTEDEIDELVRVGAVLYQEALSQREARADLETTMRESSIKK
jgi:hypothetical protein